MRTSAPRTLFDSPERASAEAGLLGMRLFLAALGMLFGAAVVGFTVIRLRVDEWPPAGGPGLPALGLAAATLLLVLLSAALVIAERGIRAGRASTLLGGLAAALGLAVAFLLAQGLNWSALLAVDLVPRSSLFAFSFFVLTALHGLHVLAGLPPLAVATVRARRGRYTAGSHQGVRYVAMYWHFLGVAWLLLLAVLAL